MNTPKLCRHKGRGLGYVTLNGVEHYLGIWPPGARRPPASVLAAYDDLIATWIANGRRLPDPAPPETTVNDVILAYVKYAIGHYREVYGTVCGEVEGIKDAAAIVKTLCGREPAANFGPKILKQARGIMLEKGWSRSYTNKQVNRLKRMFRWAAEEELVPAEVAARVWAIRAIRRGEPGVRETEPIKPVSDEHISAILPHLSAQVRAMVELQRITGMRPAEVCSMRTIDVDRTAEVWIYRPAHHKTMHRGQTREVFIGPKGQAILEPWLRSDAPESPLFSPAEAEKARHAARSAARKTPKWKSHMKRNAAKRKGVAKRDQYDADSYRRAIEYACKRAGIPAWAPNRLRHSAATEIRKTFGIETARIILGHKTAFTTEIYAEVDREAAAEAVKKAG